MGILIDNELSFTHQINMVAKKANGIMAVIRISFTCIDCKCFNLLYKSVVKPHLEYGVIVWFPYKMKDIEAVEKVQKKATKQVKQLKHWNYSDDLQD